MLTPLYASGTRTLLLLLGDLHFFTSAHAVSPVSFLFVFGIAFHLCFPLHCSTVNLKWFSFWRLSHIISVNKDNDHVRFFDLGTLTLPSSQRRAKRRRPKILRETRPPQSGRREPTGKGTRPDPAEKLVIAGWLVHFCSKRGTAIRGQSRHSQF
jgi:hypothetical protein